MENCIDCQDMFPEIALAPPVCAGETCAELFDTACVVHQEAIAELSLPVKSRLSTILNAIIVGLGGSDVESGTYTPIIVNELNSSLSSASLLQSIGTYTRIGNIVHVTVRGYLQSDTVGETYILVTLPIPTTIFAFEGTVGSCGYSIGNGTWFSTVKIECKVGLVNSTTVQISATSTTITQTGSYNVQFEYQL